MNKDLLFGFAACPICEVDKFKAIDEVIDGCTIFNELKDKERFRRAVHRRELIDTTGIGHGVAIAHGKIPPIDKVRIGLGISANGVEFAAKDGLPVHILFVIASSPGIQVQYIKALATILRNVRDTDIRKEVLSLFAPGFEPKRSEDLLRELARQSF
ncbi:MAG: PTS sugar transporter subunit IIA [Spirochaetia bacterium]|jgi:PTS system nitrogen regulatory IIA component|nr:PTS sugar transporter subunit IIA [Spirochaetia bacterium]